MYHITRGLTLHTKTSVTNDSEKDKEKYQKSWAKQEVEIGGNGGEKKFKKANVLRDMTISTSMNGTGW